jgi:hypothetical protein
VLFENFTDFEPFDPSGSKHQFHTSNKSAAGSYASGDGGMIISSKSVAHNGSPVSALLEDWCAQKLGHRSTEGNAGGFLSGFGGGSSSFNSAPLLTPSNIWGQVHSLRHQQQAGGSSISRVINNLELHMNKRQGVFPSTGSFVLASHLAQENRIPHVRGFGHLRS